MIKNRKLLYVKNHIHVPHYKSNVILIEFALLFAKFDLRKFFLLAAEETFFLALSHFCNKRNNNEKIQWKPPNPWFMLSPSQYDRSHYKCETFGNKKSAFIIIIRLMLSLWVWHEVITLSGFYFILIGSGLRVDI